MKKSFALLFGLLLFGLCYGQQKTFTGLVTSADDKMPLPGVSIVIQGTSIGTVTDVDGHFSIISPEDDVTLVFSFIGMTNIDVKPTSSVVNVEMVSELVGVEEVIVVAYGTAKKESFTGSASVVSSDKLEKRTVSSVSKALEGVVAGIQTTSGGGQPGASPAIRIRGIGSINASSAPLYVVDGIPFDGELNSINPDDVESMSVLKDASASALYGARGANGVIIITTKKGSATREPEIQFKTVFGTSERAFPNYSTVTPAEFMELTYEGYKNQLYFDEGYSMEDAANFALNGSDENNLGNYVDIYGGEKYNPYNMSSEQLIDPATGQVNTNAQYRYMDDWFEEATRETPIRQEYLLSMRGGSGKTTYLMSAGYLDEKGIVENSSFKRFTGRVNVDSQLKDWLKGGMNFSYANTNQNYLTNKGTSYNNIWYSTNMIAPVYPVYMYDDAGNAILNSEGNRQYDYGETRSYNSNYNVIAALFDDSRNYTANNFNARSYLELSFDKERIEFLKGIRLRVNYGFDYNSGDQLVYQNPYHGDAGNVGGRSWKNLSSVSSYTFNQLLSWNRRFGAHHFDILAGHEFYKLKESSVDAIKEGFPFEGVDELAVAANTSLLTSVSDIYAVESFLSRINYDYADRYYISASYRKDGSSRFFKDSRWGDFWSIGASWRISEEEFMASQEWINNLTFKASYGEQGNDMLMQDNDNDGVFDPNYYAWQSFYDLSFPNSSLNGAMISSLENNGLRWEKNQNMNFGLEARLFERMSVSVEWFNKLTSDLLLFKPLATSTGFNGIWSNIGNMVNRGIEVDLNVDLVRTNDFNWNFGTQFTRFRNEVTELVEEGQEIVDGASIIKVGEPINSFYMSRSAGVDPMNGNPLYWKTITETDANGVETEKEVITDSYAEAGANKYVLGSRVPDFYGSFSSDWSYKGFGLSILFTYSVGGKVYDPVYASLLDVRSPGNNLHKDILRRWQKPGDITDIPKMQFGSVDETSDRYLFDASYFSTKNVSLSYSIPKSVLFNTGIEQCRLFVTADNLFIFTQLKGMDPQYNFSGGQNFSFVPIRVISLGLDVKF